MKRVVAFALGAMMALSLATSALAAQPLSLQLKNQATIGISGGQDTMVETKLVKYGGEDTAKIRIDAPEAYGELRLRDKDILVGDEVIKSISYRDGILTVKPKFPTDMEEPENFVIDTLFTGKDNSQSFKVRVTGTVFIQSSPAAAPGSFKEKQCVVVDFELNDGDIIRFRGGQLETQELESGIANLDISYTEPQGVNFEGKLLHSVHFIANPRLDRAILVSFEADTGNVLYEVKNGKAVKLSAKYAAKDGFLQFKTNRLGQYVLLSGELTDTAADKGANSVPTIKPAAPVQNNPEKQNPMTGAYPLF
ncbi:MAG: hypothetical protein HFG27_12360 [Provencibacterium sp.]|jgi:hypothetical protein|nr:hypothetical protein [Provencibacterium sp.]